MSDTRIATATLPLTNGRSGRHPHVLLLPFPAQGHVTPFMELAKRLAAQGVEITFASMQHIHEKVTQAWNHSRDLSRFGHHIHLSGMSDGLPPEFDRETWSRQLNDAIDVGLEEGALQLVRNLVSAGRPITCIISDFFLRWTSSLAEKIGAPEWIFWPQSAGNFSIYLHTEEIICSGVDPFKIAAEPSGTKDVAVQSGPGSPQRTQPTEVVTCIPGFPMGVPVACLPFSTPFGNASAEWVREMLIQCFDRVSQAQGMIGNSFEALEQGILEELTQRLKKQQSLAERNRRWPRSFRMVGPLVVDGTLYRSGGEKVSQLSGTSFWREEVAECKDWLDKQPVGSVVYVAFGSLKVLTASQVQEVLLGMAASGQRFLMVVRKNAILSTETPANQNTSRVPLEEALPPGFLESIKERCKLVQWAPQTMVLAHPSVGGFFSHCGWNSTLESLCCGVPILGWPWIMDQTSNCWMLAHVWKVGLALECDEANQTAKDKVETGIRQLMEGSLAESLRAQAMKIRDQAREAARMNQGLLSLAQEIHLLTGNL